jgi:hypothetical protein
MPTPREILSATVSVGLDAEAEGEIVLAVLLEDPVLEDLVPEIVVLVVMVGPELMVILTLSVPSINRICTFRRLSSLFDRPHPQSE